ncbi:hypothetical protein GUJ93_ZPchr0001g32348 [Zizania palustris]|uniref:Uncharacterized protein n=1 Tax=Zizania palustris TaxID=103762 RepID=A0A8J5RER2_ZIZPA|nr:hypothetical protein GUJ93_ZPchr0001g32348 [Zizania palustris]
MASTSLSLHFPTAFPIYTAAGTRSRVRRAPRVVPAPFSPLLLPAATPAVPRRILVLAAAGIWDFLSGGAGGAAAASLAVRRGMQLFKQGDVAGSVAEFDQAIELDQRQKQYLWQRGLSLYYLDRFEEAQLYGVEEARKRFLEVGIDSRPVMREAYALFKDVGILKSWLQTFLVVLVVKFSIHHYTLDFTMNLRRMQSWPSPTLLQHAGHPMDQGLEITWLHLH